MSIEFRPQAHIPIGPRRARHSRLKFKDYSVSPEVHRGTRAARKKRPAWCTFWTMTSERTVAKGRIDRRSKHRRGCQLRLTVSSLLFSSLPFASLPFPSLPFPSLAFPFLSFPSFPFLSLPLPLPFPFPFPFPSLLDKLFLSI